MPFVFYCLGAAMVLVGLVALYVGSDPATLTYGQTLMTIGAVMIGSGVVTLALALVSQRLGAILARLPLDGEGAGSVHLPSVGKARDAARAAAGMDDGRDEHHAHQPHPDQPDLFEARLPPTSAQERQAQELRDQDLHHQERQSDEKPAQDKTAPERPTPPARPPRDLDALVAGFGNRSRPPAPEPEPASQSTNDVADLTPPPLDLPPLVLGLDRKAARDDEAGMQATVESDKTHREAFDLGLPVLPPTASAPRPSEWPAFGQEEPQVVKDGVIADIPFRLYADGSISADLSTGTVKFANLKEFRAHVGG